MSIKSTGFVCLLALLVNAASVRFVHAYERCQPGSDQTLYAADLINQIKLNSEMKLPQRYIGSIFLKYGGIFNVSSVNLIDQPVKVICANRTLGALQIKLSIDQVILAYSWSFGEKCEGIAKTEPQDIYIDLNLEKNQNDKKTRILSSYTSALLVSEFNVFYKKPCNYLNTKMLENQIKNVSKKAALHDVDLILQSQVKQFTNDFINKNELLLY